MSRKSWLIFSLGNSSTFLFNLCLPRQEDTIHLTIPQNSVSMESLLDRTPTYTRNHTGFLIYLFESLFCLKMVQTGSVSQVVVKTPNHPKYGKFDFFQSEGNFSGKFK